MMDQQQQSQQQSAVQALMLAASMTPSTASTPSDASPALEGRFDATMFRSLYQRNNKRGGLKNLRCFPSCSAEHRVRGFCGRSVVVTFRPSSIADLARLYSMKFRAFVEFEEEPFETKRPTELAAEDVERKLRSKQEPTNPLIEGKYAWTKDGILVFEFNQERRGWHYSWGSNKHKCDTKHHLLCQLFEERTPGQLSLIANCSSPEFVLFCRRRRRFTLEPTGQIVSANGPNASSASASKRPRKSPLEAKVVQEMELLNTVQRIEASRQGVTLGTGSAGSVSSNTATEEDEEMDEDDDEDDDEEDEDDEEEVTRKPNQRISSSSSSTKRLKSSPAVTPLKKPLAPVGLGVDLDITDATHALLALNSSGLFGARVNGSGSPSAAGARA